jgi:septin 3/9/12
VGWLGRGLWERHGLGLTCSPLASSHLQDLKDITHNVHYENYRVIRLNESHLLPRGPGWVNLAPASPGQLTSSGYLKARRRAQKDTKDDEC